MKYYVSPRWSGEYLDCSMPMTFDTYNKCSANCLYCFSYFQKSHDNTKNPDPTRILRRKEYQKIPVEYVNENKVKKLFNLETNSQFNDYICNRYVMQWGGLADQHDMHEKKYGITLNLMRYFDKIKYPLSFSTKFTWWLYDENYMELVRRNPQWHYKISIINLDEEKAKKMEGGVPTPQERLNGIKILADAGCHVTLRLRPFIIGYSNSNNEHLKLIEEAAKNGADSVSTEFFCMEQRADPYLKKRYDEMSKIMGFDINKFYRDNSYKRGYLRLNYEIKKPYIKEMKDKCDELGLRFYVSDAHHKEKSHNGSCCGLPCSFNYFKGQMTSALVLAKEKGEVSFDDIENDCEFFKNFYWRYAEGLNTTGTETRLKFDGLTLFDVIKRHWNQPNKANLPYKYFNGILYPVRVNQNGNVVYKYNKDKAKL